MTYFYNEEKRLKNEKKKKKYCSSLLKTEINFDLNYKE